eukprot:CAMPEP_0178403432 /NCGR_PEP_ID=MMETSP0689_2-20121128/17365_1 /TAXON_ID=160604 /ORGANISM="Amphidinium massartii, Strain CS-259" /LENGTH=565 /DNA_ID=CAMNT_0020024385 /DNA_START=26 /DNA_END=1723 /DNA_ORIENTATION=-
MSESVGTAGPPKVFGPQGASKPTSFGPPGWTPPPPEKEKAQPAASSSSSAAPTAAAGGDASASSTASPSSSPADKKPEPKEPPPPSSTAADDDLDPPGEPLLPFPEGTLARIVGLKSATAASLNGELCSILRAADSAERVVVKTRLGEKSLKPANLQVGNCVYPRGSGYVPAVIGAVATVAMADAFRTRGLNGISTATIPVCASICVLLTLGLSAYLHRPCKKDDSWVPAVSALGSSMAARRVYRVGFIAAGILAASTVWLTGELLLTQLQEPLPPPPLPPPPPLAPEEPAAAVESGAEEESPAATDDVDTAAGTGADADAATADAFAEDPEDSGSDDSSESPDEEEDSPVSSGHSVESSEAGDAASEASSDNSSALNATERRLAFWRNETALMEWAPASMTKWGYIAAAGLAAQGLFAFDDKLSVQSVLHGIGFSAFAVGALQHVVLANSVLGGTAARAMPEAWSPLRKVLRLRRYLADGGPAALMVVVLISQSTSITRPTAARQRSPVTMTTRGILKESGLGKSIAMMQWAALVLMAVFYCTFAFDFWVGSQLAGQTLIEVDM